MRVKKMRNSDKQKQKNFSQILSVFKSQDKKK